MAITLKKLLDKTDKNYHLKLIAGEEALDNIVQWVHIVEDIEVADFLRGNEMVFSTGIRQVDLSWMLPFVKHLHRNGASAWVLNLGPYVKDIPEEVIQYCRSNFFPLFTVPWKVRLVDMTRDFCNQIILREEVETKVSTAFRNAIFQSQNEESYVPILSRRGYDLKGRFVLIALEILGSDELKDKNADTVKLYADSILSGLGLKYTFFSHHEKQLIVIADCGESTLKYFMSNLMMTCKPRLPLSELVAAIGFNRKGIETLEINFKKTIETLKLAIKRGQSILYYDELSIYKLLLSSDDHTSITELYDETIGKLQIYDEKNDTDYLTFLKRYLDCDCNVKALAEQDFIHRNTVHYHLNKIKKIINCDFSNLDDKLKLRLGYYISEVL